MTGWSEFRDPRLARALVTEISRTVSQPWTLMEICGGQTHAILRHGIDRLLPKGLELIHGPGCPVCVTPTSVLDAALDVALRPGVVFCTFGDMLRVPGSRDDLSGAKAAGADVRMVYSPVDAVHLAQAHPDREVVFFGVGFETTAPATALALVQAAERGLRNFFLLASHVLVPPALEVLLADPDCRVRGLLAAGHVCAVMGMEEYAPLAERYRLPIVVTGFEPVDLLEGILACVRQLESGRHEVENAYARAVRDGGNPAAVAWVRRVFEVVPRAWRGLGTIAASGLALREEYRGFDAWRHFGLAEQAAETETECRSAWVLQGRMKPPECPHFGGRCTPQHPMGATMVSAEGACAAYYQFRGICEEAP